MEKHSPGPWTWMERDDDSLLLDRNEDEVLCMRGQWTDVLPPDARLIAEVPAFLALARYAAERGEGDAEMAREILARIDADPGV